MPHLLQIKPTAAKRQEGFSLEKQSPRNDKKDSGKKKSRHETTGRIQARKKAETKRFLLFSYDGTMGLLFLLDWFVVFEHHNSDFAVAIGDGGLAVAHTFLDADDGDGLTLKDSDFSAE